MSDITQRYHHGDEFSTEAHHSIKADKERIREMVYNCIEQAPNGRTCDEVEIILGMSHQGTSARFTELKASGRIKQVFKRATRSGRNAGVYICT